jgi:cell division protein FtsL
VDDCGRARCVVVEFEVVVTALWVITAFFGNRFSVAEKERLALERESNPRPWYTSRVTGDPNTCMA